MDQYTDVVPAQMIGPAQPQRSQDDMLKQLLGLRGLEDQGGLLHDQLAAAIALGRRNQQHHASAIGGALGGLNDSLAGIASVVQQNRIGDAEKTREGEIEKRLGGLANLPGIRRLLFQDDGGDQPQLPAPAPGGGGMGELSGPSPMPMGPAPAAAGGEGSAAGAAAIQRRRQGLADIQDAVTQTPGAFSPKGLLDYGREQFTDPSEAVAGAVGKVPGALDPWSLLATVEQQAKQADNDRRQREFAASKRGGLPSNGVAKR